LPRVRYGDAIAVMQIPRLGTNLVIAQGDGPEQLRSGPGHRPGTPYPGSIGNSIVSAHASAWGGPFAALHDLKRGDHIVVQPRASLAGPNGIAPTYVFTVTDVVRTNDRDTAWYGTSNDHRLTLVTGRGGRFSTGRLVVVAVSGQKGRLARPDAEVVAATPGRGLAHTGSTALFVVSSLVAIAVVLSMRGRYGRGSIVAVTTPLVTLALLGLLLGLDRLLSPVR
jgi:LPXTG-site transpeptidase (sortase) family protein